MQSERGERRGDTDRILRSAVRLIFNANWTTHGYTVPNPVRYPAQWLWDSCFHALVWAELADERAITEIEAVFRRQAASGFVPHITYDACPIAHAALWNRSDRSLLTQPPMYGHALAELARKGFPISERLIEQATKGLRYLLDRRRRVAGMVTIVHPWESGMDDSPRWDHWLGDARDPLTRFNRKGALVRSLDLLDDGSPNGNQDFAVAPAGFNALVAFNALELASLSGDARLAADASALTEAVDHQWRPELGTWADASEEPSIHSHSIQTLDAMLPLLIADRPAIRKLAERSSFGTLFGPSSVHVAEPEFGAGTYWRGSAWPQMIYLLQVAAIRRQAPSMAKWLRSQLVSGTARSGCAEYWNSETGAGLGCAPHSWSGLAIVRPSTAIPDGRDSPHGDSGPRPQRAETYMSTLWTTRYR